jgi:hypothetical protein
MRQALKRRTGVRDRGEEPGTVSSSDGAKRKFKEGAVLPYGGEGEHRKQVGELQASQNHGIGGLRHAGSHSPGALIV